MSICCKYSTDLLQVVGQNLLSTGLLQVFPRDVRLLQMANCNKPDLDGLDEIYEFVTTW